jgi:dTDP-glucose 4,6-dehydratase
MLQPRADHKTGGNTVKVLVTGGAGFIGSNFIRWVLTENSDARVLNLDKLTYSGNLENLADVAISPECRNRYRFVRGDITDVALLESLLEENFDAIVNFAAETHVDRSIQSAQPFLHTNYLGTHSLIEAARRRAIPRFIQISTDEVYGSADEGRCFSETALLRPSNPYAASKAAADLLVLSYVITYKFPALVLRCSNNYGPCQFPEKLIPLMIANAMSDKPLPVYGDGLNVRDWIYVDDHCRAIYLALMNGQNGQVYNVGGVALRTNLEVVQGVLRLLGKPESLITFVEDRPGHDRCYSLDSSKLRSELTWSPLTSFEEGLERTTRWYVDHCGWLENCRSHEYLEYYRKHYTDRPETFRRLGVSA